MDHSAHAHGKWQFFCVSPHFCYPSKLLTLKFSKWAQLKILDLIQIIQVTVIIITAVAIMEVMVDVATVPAMAIIIPNMVDMVDTVDTIWWWWWWVHILWDPMKFLKFLENSQFFFLLTVPLWLQRSDFVRAMEHRLNRWPNCFSACNCSGGCLLWRSQILSWTFVLENLQ